MALQKKLGGLKVLCLMAVSSQTVKPFKPLKLDIWTSPQLTTSGNLFSMYETHIHTEQFFFSCFTHFEWVCFS